MRIALAGLLLFVLSSFLLAQPPRDEDLKKLEGTWKVASLEIDGKTAPQDKTPKQFVIAGNKLTGLGPEMTLALDATTKPKSMDLTFKKGDKSFSIKGIYELAGDELKICFSMAEPGKLFENIRPQGFDTAGKGTALFKGKRLDK